jgi:arylsulfatase A-like enzyme
MRARHGCRRPRRSYHSVVVVLKAAARYSVLAALVAGLGCRAKDQGPGLDLIGAFATAERRSDSWDVVGVCAESSEHCPGFSPLERNGAERWIWMDARRASIRLPVHSTAEKVLRFRVHAHPSLAPAVELKVSWNGASLGSFRVGVPRAEFRVVVPASAQSAGDGILSFESSTQRVPARVEADRRTLVVAFADMEVTPASGSQRGTIPERVGSEVQLPPQTSLVYYWRAHGGSELRVRPTSASGDAEIDLRVDDDHQNRAKVAERISRLKTLSVPLSVEAGAIVRLVVANTGPATLRLTEARISWPPERPRPPVKLPVRPNVVLYVVDTLRADVLGAYGFRGPTSPRFDAFAREALLFEDASAPAPWTRASVASLFTGLLVSEHGVDREHRALAAGRETLAERLKAAGYRTCAFVANHLVDARFGFAQGFDTWNEGGESFHDRPAAELVDRGLRCATSGEGPFLLYVHANEPHSPYEPTAASRGLFDSESYRGNKDTKALLRLGQIGTLAPDGLEFLKRRYRGEVHDADAAFGRLVDGLRERGLLDRSVVVFTADHGEEFREHGGTEHAKTLYQELIRVPLAVRIPGPSAPVGRVVGAVELIDIVPTLSSLLGLAENAGVAQVSGRDRSGDWLARSTPAGDDRVRFAEARFQGTDKISARAGPFKLIVNNDDPALWRAGVKREAYDIGGDPGERANIVERLPVTAGFLLRSLEAMRLAARASGGGQEVELTPEDRERLRALGYID